MKRILLLTMLLCLLPTLAQAAEYEITAYEMTVDVQRDGSASIRETLTYDFDGSYNGILSAFDVSDVDGLDDLELTVDDGAVLTRVDSMQRQPFTYTLKSAGDFLNVQAYAPGNGGMRVFRYTYRLRGLCQRYRDAARLNYKLIGILNQRTLKNATIRITLPGEVYDAWAHGAMRNRDVHRIDSPRVQSPASTPFGRSFEGDSPLEATSPSVTLVYGPVSVPRGRYVEADILFDAASLPNAPIIAQDVIPSARSLEAALSEQQQAEDRKQASILGVLCTLVMAFGAGAALLLRNIGAAIGYRKTIPARGDPQVLMGVHAAVAQWIYEKKVDEHALTGTLMELVAAGALQMNKPEGQSDEPSFVIKDRFVEGLSPAQRHVMGWLFDGPEPITSSRLDAGTDVERARFNADRLEKLEALVRDEAQQKGYLSGASSAYQKLLIIFGVGVLLCIGLFCSPWKWLGAPAVLITLLPIAQAARLRRFSDEGERVYAALADLAQRPGAQDVNPKDALWLLPLSAALGQLEPFFERMEALWQPDFEPYPYWMYTDWHHDMRHIQLGMGNSFTHNRELISSQSSSSDGGGGSFDNGGSSGGGGGGGGHGAW